jgi:hypothetical protein
VNIDPALRLGLGRRVGVCQFNVDHVNQEAHSAQQQMPRGRRKDTTIPPSRALIIQRAYRERKAKYISDLEDRCRKAEEENERLRRELELARSHSAVASINSDLVNRLIFLDHAPRKY